MRFTLIPFSGLDPPSQTHVFGSVIRRGTTLILRFRLEGALEIEFPPREPQPERRDGLWRATCFEVFVARPDEPGYWECNLSPAGHWNVYRFTDYRQGMAEEEGFADLPFEVTLKAGALTLAVGIDLAAIGLEEGAVALGLAAVLLSKTGAVTHHALSHPHPPQAGKGQPDFHHRGGFRRLTALTEDPA